MNIEEYMVINATKKRIPLSAVFELLPHCNMNCKMCYIKSNLKNAENLKSVEEWIQYANQMKKQGTLFVLLTGGEPLLYSGFQKLYLELIKMGMIVSINTNGTLINEEMAAFLGKNKPRRVNISLYGSSSETYAKLCGYKQGYEQVIQGISFLKKNKVDVKINGSLTMYNVADMEALLGIAEAFSVPIQIDTYMYKTEENARVSPEEAARVKRDVLKHTLIEEEYSKYCKQIIRLEERKSMVKSDCSMKCRAGKSSFVVDWRGYIRPCIMMDGPSINIDSLGFEKAWKAIHEETQKIYESKTCSECAYRCICQNCVASSLRETGKHNEVSEYLCDYTKKFVKLINPPGN